MGMAVRGRHGGSWTQSCRVPMFELVFGGQWVVRPGRALPGPPGLSRPGHGVERCHEGLQVHMVALALLRPDWEVPVARGKVEAGGRAGEWLLRGPRGLDLGLAMTQKWGTSRERRGQFMVDEQGPTGRGFHMAPCFQLRQHKSGCLVLAPGTWGPGVATVSLWA